MLKVISKPTDCVRGQSLILGLPVEPVQPVEKESIGTLVFNRQTG
jgi:hypothetical protein